MNYIKLNDTIFKIKASSITRSFFKDNNGGWSIEIIDEEKNNFLNIITLDQLDSIKEVEDLANQKLLLKEEYELAQHLITLQCGKTPWLHYLEFHFSTYNPIDRTLLCEIKGKKEECTIEIKANMDFTGYYFYGYEEGEIIDFLKNNFQLSSFTLDWEILNNGEKRCRALWGI